MHLGRQPAGRLGLAGLLVAGVLAVTFGTGYTATRSLSDNGSVWLRKGDTVAQINAPSRRLESTVPGSLVASPGSPLQIVQDPDGTVWVAEPGSNKVARINQSTMAPGEPTSGDAVLSSTGLAYAVNSKQGTVTPLDPGSGQPTGKPIAVGAPLQSQLLVGQTVYVVTTAGQLVTINGTSKGKARSLAGAGDQVTLAAAGSSPVAVNATSGRVVELTGDQRSIALPGVAGSSVHVASNQPGPDLWLVRGTQLVDVNLGSGATTTASLPSTGKYEAPVVLGNRAYVPNQTTNSVAVYGTGNLAPVHTFQLPAGAPGNPGGIEVVAKEGAVWADTPSAENALVLTGDGTKSQTVDKGTGKGVVNPSAPTHKPTSGAGNGQPAANPPTNVPTVTPPPADATPSSPDPSPTPPTGVTPVAPIPDSPPTTTSGSTTTTSTTTPTTKSVNLMDYSGQPEQSSCDAINNEGLNCVPSDQGQAPTGKTPDVVISQDQKGQVPAGTKVTLTYYSSPADVAVPDVSGKDPTTACSLVIQAGLTNCQSKDLGAAPVGTATNQVTATEPPAGTATPPTTPVSVDYYSSQAPVTVGDCTGSVAAASVTSQCQTAGITYTAVEKDNPGETTCNVSWGQDQPPGTAVPQGTTVSVYYDSHCLTPLNDWVELNKEETDGTSSVFDYLSTGGDSAATYQAGYLGDVYTTQESGTVPLYEYHKSGGSGSSASADYYHYFSTGGTPSGGWSEKQVVGYVWSSAPAGVGNVSPVYYSQKLTKYTYLDADESFTSSCPSLGTTNSGVAWYAPWTTSPTDTSPTKNNFC